MTTNASTHRARRTRWVPFALLLLSVVPVVSGSLRLAGMLGGPHLMPVDTRIDAFPLPVVVHIASVIPYALLGAFQFSARLRRSRPGWHRAAGRVLVVLGVTVAVSGLWMTLGYPAKAGSGELLRWLRVAVGTTMLAGIAQAVAAVRRGDIARHRAWMTRSYALALGAGTQAVTGAVGPALLGTGVLANDLAMGAGWVINLAVAEVAIRRGSGAVGRPRLRPRPAVMMP